MPLDYTREAEHYDATRGGQARAEAAAAAVDGLLPGPGRLLDVAGGTGIVSARLAARGHRVAVADLVVPMLRHAQPRLPGAAVCMDAGRLAVADASLDAVTMVWLLHLVSDAEPLLAEAARVLRPGGRLVTTVDKAAACGDTSRAATDDGGLVTRLAARHGLAPAGEGSFTAVGQPGRPVYRVLAFRRR